MVGTPHGKRGDDPVRRAAEVKHLVSRLSLNELRMARLWLEDALWKHRRNTLRLVETPSVKDPDALAAASAVEIAGSIRHMVHLLPSHTVEELSRWVRRRVEHNPPS